MAASTIIGCMWNLIGTEGYDESLELAVLVDGEPHWSLAPCRRVIGGWVHCETHAPVRKRPTHWRQAKAVGERTTGFATVAAPDSVPLR
jgi:hypothetical protein